MCVSVQGYRGKLVWIIFFLKRSFSINRVGPYARLSVCPRQIAFLMLSSLFALAQHSLFKLILNLERGSAGTLINCVSLRCFICKAKLLYTQVMDVQALWLFFIINSLFFSSSFTMNQKYSKSTFPFKWCVIIYSKNDLISPFYIFSWFKKNISIKILYIPDMLV